jgi:hypothetical protein
MSLFWENIFHAISFAVCVFLFSYSIRIEAMLGAGSGTALLWTGVTSGVLREVQGARKEATPATPGAHGSEWSIASPAQQGAPATTCPDPYRTPNGGPQADPCLALAPFLFEEGRPLQRLKEKRTHAPRQLTAPGPCSHGNCYSFLNRFDNLQLANN